MDDQHPCRSHLSSIKRIQPGEIKEAVEKVGVKKTRIPPQASFMLAMVAGGGIGLGALYYTIVASDSGELRHRLAWSAAWCFRSGWGLYWWEAPSCLQVTT